MADRAVLARARADLGVFGEMVGRPLTDWQCAALTLEARTTIIVGGRQTGKSRSLALLAVHRAFRTPDFRVLVISSGEVGARRLLADVRSLIAASPTLAVSLVDENAGLVRLSNGSEIRCVPASEAQVRGWSVDLLLIDEAAMVGDELILGAALATTAARPDARIVLSSSPRGTSGVFYELATRGFAGDADVAAARWPTSLAPWVTAEAEAAMRAAMPPVLADAEFGAIFGEFGDGLRLYPEEWITAAVARDLPGLGPLSLRDLPGGGALRLGVDVARSGGDETVGVQVRGGRVRVAFCGRGWDLMRTAQHVVQASAGEPGARVAVDETGVGAGVVDRARQLAPVVGFVSAARARLPQRFANLRAESYQRLADALRDGLLDIDPADRELVAQLRSVRWTTDRLGRVLIESKDSLRARGVPSPDRVDALVMALSLDEGWRPAPEPLSDEERAARELEEALLAQERAVRARDRWGSDRGSLPADWKGGSVMSDILDLQW